MGGSFSHAIVRKPCPAMVNGITTANLGKPDYGAALVQHHRYTELLESCGLQITVLEGDNRFPDSTFVEDVAVCTRRFAILANPGAPARNGEKDIIKPVLDQFYETIEEVFYPGTLDGGDVMMADSHFYIGLSDRTNRTGAAQLIRILKKYGMTGSIVPLRGMLHLKTGVSYLEENTMLVSGKLADDPEFIKYRRIIIPADEAYAANSLWINGMILVPEGYPKTVNNLVKAGYQVMTTDVSEFRKLDGGLSCLSLRF